MKRLKNMIERAPFAAGWSLSIIVFGLAALFALEHGYRFVAGFLAAWSIRSLLQFLEALFCPDDPWCIQCFARKVCPRCTLSLRVAVLAAAPAEPHDFAEEEAAS